jgi:NAD(P)-dependent dehydrogenase (short-subunit alcohol dehydrogenase family)
MKKKPVALVTGAGRGIGRAIALELARDGYDLAGVSRRFDPDSRKNGLGEVKEKAEKLGAVFLPVSGDIASLEDHERIVGAVLRRYGRIDLLVNNAGVAPLVRADLLETTSESFDRVLGINLRGTFFLSQRVAREMIGRGKKQPGIKPKIIFITSVSAYISSTRRAEYCISKAALSHAAQIFADRLTRHGIGVYEIRPGIIKTDMNAAVHRQYDRLIAGGLVPQNRWGFPEDVARAVAAIARGSFDYSSGMIFEVSGGMGIRSLNVEQTKIAKK